MSSTAAQLRPFGIGEIRDAQIKVYRSKFATMLTAVAVVIVPVQVLSVLIRLSLPSTSTTVIAVSPEDVTTLRQFLERRLTLSPGARAHLAPDLAARVRRKVVGAPDGWHPESFLEGVVAAKTARG